MLFALSFCFVLFLQGVYDLSPVWVSVASVSIGIRSGISVVSAIEVGSISISLWLSISRSLSVVSVGTIGIWVSISVGSVSKTISVSSIEESSISISLWLSISRSFSVVSVGVWVSSISIMSSIAKAISSVQEIGISISLWLGLWLSSGKSGTADHKSKLHHVENLRVQ